MFSPLSWCFGLFLIFKSDSDLGGSAQCQYQTHFQFWGNQVCLKASRHVNFYSAKGWLWWFCRNHSSRSLWLTSGLGNVLISQDDKSWLRDLGVFWIWLQFRSFKNNQQPAFRLNYIIAINPHIFCPDVTLLAKPALCSTFTRRPKISKSNSPY